MGGRYFVTGVQLGMLQALKEKESEKILFEHYLRIEQNKKTNTKSITSFFK